MFVTRSVALGLQHYVTGTTDERYLGVKLPVLHFLLFSFLLYSLFCVIRSTWLLHPRPGGGKSVQWTILQNPLTVSPLIHLSHLYTVSLVYSETILRFCLWTRLTQFTQALRKRAMMIPRRVNYRRRRGIVPRMMLVSSISVNSLGTMILSPALKTSNNKDNSGEDITSNQSKTAGSGEGFYDLQLFPYLAEYLTRPAPARNTSNINHDGSGDKSNQSKPAVNEQGPCEPYLSRCYFSSLILMVSASDPPKSNDGSGALQSNQSKPIVNGQGPRES